jgi:hypothetical protein
MCVQAPEHPTTHDKRGWGSWALAMIELHVKLFEALFFFCSVLGLHPRLRLRAFTPLDDGTS